jgi:hypothetical protein
MGERLPGSGADSILDYCIGEIEGSKGLMTVWELEGRTGYSSRWLYDKFIEKVGLSPKNLLDSAFYLTMTRRKGRMIWVLRQGPTIRRNIGWECLSDFGKGRGWMWAGMYDTIQSDLQCQKYNHRA